MTDPEKWLNVIGDDTPNMDDDEQSNTIKLKAITPDDIGKNSIKYVPKKSRKNAYFVRDKNTILSDDDVLYQIVNYSETTQKKTLLPEVLRQDLKLTDNLDKLLKTPERCLAPVLKPYYARNLKFSKETDDFQISYDEIQQDVKTINELRKKGKKIQSTNGDVRHFDNDDNNEILSPPSMKSQDSSSNKKLTTTISPLTTTITPSTSKSSTSSALLKELDCNFTPKIVLGTKTYSRKIVNPAGQ